MFKQHSTKDLTQMYTDRPWINKNALTNLFLSAFAEAVLPEMDKAMEKLYKILSSTEFIAKIEEDIVDDSIKRVIEKIKDDLRKGIIKGMLFDEE